MTGAQLDALYRALNDLAQLRDRVARELPPSRETSFSLTKLDEAKLWLREITTP